MKKQDPAPGQRVWYWSYKHEAPRAMIYVGRNKSWREWERFEPDLGTTKKIRLNGLPDWHQTDHECAWAHFAGVVRSVHLRAQYGNRDISDRDIDYVYACAAEYTRRMADSFRKKAGEVWDEGRYPIGDALRIAREAVEAGAVDEIYLSRLREALHAVYGDPQPEQKPEAQP